MALCCFGSSPSCRHCAHAPSFSQESGESDRLMSYDSLSRLSHLFHYFLAYLMYVNYTQITKFVLFISVLRWDLDYKENRIISAPNKNSINGKKSDVKSTTEWYIIDWMMSCHSHWPQGYTYANQKQIWKYFHSMILLEASDVALCNWKCKKW